MCKDHIYINNMYDAFENSEETVNDNVGEFFDTIDELIIVCVQSYPHLYNKNDKNYKDNMMKIKSWEEIAKTCHLSIDEVQQRWKRLKERYGKQRRLNELATRSGSAMQKIKQWPLFESMKFMEKHIQRRRTFSNVSLQLGTKLHITPEKSHFSHQRENILASQSNQNITQLFQELKKRQSTAQINEGLKKVSSIIVENNRMENVIGKKFSEDHIEKSVYELPRNLENSEVLVPNTYKTSIKVPQTSMSFKSACVSDISKSNASSTSFTATLDNSQDVTISSDRSSEASDYIQNNLSLNKLNSSSGEEVIRAKLSTTANVSSLNVPTKCFFGGSQRRKKNNSDILETSFISATNVLKEYLLEKKEEKENYQPADEHLAKFIVSRLSQLPEENRDEKRKKIIDVLLSK